MPSSSPSARGADVLEQAQAAARELGRRTGADRHDVLVVLGSGLSPIASLLGAAKDPIDLTTLPWFPRLGGYAQRSEAWSVQIRGLQVLVNAGRPHLYDGLDANEVAHPVRTAIAAGCSTIVLTSAVAAIRPDLVDAAGSVVLVEDHLNLTARSPLWGVGHEDSSLSPFVDLVGSWSPRLRDVARRVEPSLSEGVLAELLGPNFETPAETRMLAALGADMVGTSTVIEAIAARHLGAEVLGLAAVANPAAGTVAGARSIEAMTRSVGAAVPAMGRVIAGVIEQLAGEKG